MKNMYMVFYHGERELVAYTIRETFPGEAEATIGLLAYENNIAEEDIRVEYELR